MFQKYVKEYVAGHPMLVHSEDFDELSDKLKEDVEDAIAWHG